MKDLQKSIASEPIGQRQVDVSIIVVNWHSAAYTRDCMQSIIETTHGLGYEIIVIDGASGDGCGEMLQQHFPGVIFIQAASNDGFARANNCAFAYARGRHLLFLNPDTKILGPVVETLHAKLTALEAAGAVGCKLLNRDGSMQTSCIQAEPTLLNQMLDSAWLRRQLPTLPLWGMAPLFRKTANVEAVDVISGACMMVKREVFEQVGLFSNEYFMYAEDVDLCHKIRKAGYRNYYVPEVSVMHFGGGSSEQAPSAFSTWMKRESMWLFLVKTRGAAYGFAYRISTILSSLCRMLLLLPCVFIKSSKVNNSHYARSLKKWRVVLQWGVGAAARSVKQHTS